MSQKKVKRKRLRIPSYLSRRSKRYQDRTERTRRGLMAIRERKAGVRAQWNRKRTEGVQGLFRRDVILVFGEVGARWLDRTGYQVGTEWLWSVLKESRAVVGERVVLRAQTVERECSGEKGRGSERGYRIDLAEWLERDARAGGDLRIVKGWIGWRQAPREVGIPWSRSSRESLRVLRAEIERDREGLRATEGPVDEYWKLDRVGRREQRLGRLKNKKSEKNEQQEWEGT
jgi:hypothetical protein